MKALGVFGLAIVLFAVLLLGPFVMQFTEGFADGAQEMQNPTTDSATKAKKEEELANLTGQAMPSATEPPTEGFEAILSTDLEKNSKATEMLQQAIQSSL